MRKRWIILQLLVVMLLPCSAHAYFCWGNAEPQNLLRDADVVFVGKITALEDMGIAPDELRTPRTNVVFSVEQVWKGFTEKDSHRQGVDTEAFYEYNFKVGERYLVFGYRMYPPRISMIGCPRIQKLEEAADVLKYLGKPAFAMKVLEAPAKVKVRDNIKVAPAVKTSEPAIKVPAITHPVLAPVKSTQPAKPEITPEVEIQEAPEPMPEEPVFEEQGKLPHSDNKPVAETPAAEKKSQEEPAPVVEAIPEIVPEPSALPAPEPMVVPEAEKVIEPSVETPVQEPSEEKPDALVPPQDTQPAAEAEEKDSEAVLDVIWEDPAAAKAEVAPKEAAEGAKEEVLDVIWEDPAHKTEPAKDAVVPDADKGAEGDSAPVTPPVPEMPAPPPAPPVIQ